MQKGFAPIIIILGIVLLLGIAGGAYYFGKTQTINPQPQNPDVVSSTPQPVSSPSASPAETANPDLIGANWKTWKNTSLKYEFQYPNDWEIGDSEQGSNSSVIQNVQKKYYLVINFISENQLNLMGITYCGAYPEDKDRCESRQIDESIMVGIDWGNDNQAFASISHPNGGSVTFTLKPVLAETKSIFNQILSTFKFLDQDSSNPEGKFCGGIAANLPKNQCPKGYKCQLDGNYPDAGGKCIKE